MVELSSLDVRFLARELRATEDAFVDKVYQLGPDDFLFKLRHPDRGPQPLWIRAGAWAVLAPNPPAAPETPTSLALALRKHLSGTRLRRVEQHEFDRVLRFELERHGQPFELVVEFFGRGNLILAGPDHRILLALRSETFAHRTIKRGEPLVLPPPRVNPLTMPRSEFETRAEAADKDVVRFLALDLGLGGDLAEELVHRSGVEKALPVARLPPAALDRLWNALKELLEATPRPAVTTTVKGVRVESFPLTAPIFRDAEREFAPSLSEAILRVAQSEEEQKAPAPDVERNRLLRQLEHQQRGVKELEAEAARWERRGHLLFAHYEDAARVLQNAKASLEATSWSAMAARHQKPPQDAEPWMGLVASVDPKRARIVLRLEDETIPLDPFQSLEANATLLYDESKRIRAKFENARVAVEETQRRLRERPEPAAKKPTPKARAPARRFWFETHRWFWSSDGFLVVGGRDAAGNEKLVKRHLAAGDRFIHADIHGAPSVIVKCEGEAPPESTLQEACQFGATYSKAFAQFATADAYWVHPEQVSKTAESGESVPKGAFVIRGQRHYHAKLPLAVALGRVRLDAQGRPGGPDAPHVRLMGGPPSAVARYVERPLLIERGTQKSSQAAKELAPRLGVTLDEVAAVLPPGNVRLASPPEGPS